MIASDRKRRGGYYTPRPVADFLAGWAIRVAGDRVLEPSSGDGEILAAADRRLHQVGGGTLVGVELDPVEAEKARGRASAACVHVADFFSLAERADDWTFEAVVGNPPFVRYQSFPEVQREPAFRLMMEEGLKPNRLTNAWVPFVVAATRLLAPGGRLALVVPAELLQVTYAGQLRAYLAQKFERITLLTFGRLLFDGVQQEVVLLLADGAHRGPATIDVMQLEDASDLSGVQLAQAEPTAADMDHASEKWTQYFLTPKELGLVRALRERVDIPLVSGVAEVDVGVVTGRNAFFVLEPSEARRHSLERYTTPLVGRSAQLAGLVFSERDWKALAAADQRCLLLTLDDAPLELLPDAARRYVELGEASGHHLGYKCRIRRNWHWVPSVWTPDAFLYRQIHDAPRLVVNNSEATSTDTIHRVRMRNGLRPAALSASLFNSLSFAFAEIYGRSYGGGVLELEPTEAEALPVPISADVDAADLDGLVRSGRHETALDMMDATLLQANLGLEHKDVARLRQIWRKLRDRRNERKKRSRPALPAS